MKNSFCKLLKSALCLALVLALCLPSVMVTAMADDDSGEPQFIKDVQISDLQFYADGSLKSFELSVTPASNKDYGDYFKVGTSNGAISLHTEKFGTSEEDPTGEMQYYLYNGSDGEYRYKDVILEWGDVSSDGYWENHLYKDYSCAQKGSMNTSGPIKDITWATSTDLYPQDCFFETWGLTAGGDANVIALTVGEDERFTTTTTMYFKEGAIHPGETQVYYVYLWNQWANGYPVTEYDTWGNPDGIYPDRHIFTLNTGGGIVLDTVTDTLSISGEAKVGQTLTANIMDKDDTDASAYWQNFSWKIGEQVVGTGLTYTVQEADAGKTLTFICEGKGDGRTGVLMESVTVEESQAPNPPSTDEPSSPTDEPPFPTRNPFLPASSTVESPQTGDDFHLFVPIAALTLSFAGIVLLSLPLRRRGRANR